MESRKSPLATAQAYARFACDHCRRKKLRCSREFPKCAVCRLWPGDCVYSKTAAKGSKLRPAGRSAAHSLAKKTDDDSSHDEQNSNESSSANVRATKLNTGQPSQLMDTTIGRSYISSTMGDNQSILPESASSDVEVLNRREQSDVELSSTPSAIEQSHSFAAMDRARDDLQHLGNVRQTKDSPGYQAATNSLNELCNTARSSKLDNKWTGSQRYFVPSRAVGYKLMSRFLETVELADILAMQPSDSLLQTIIFKPDSVNEPGWLVWVNFLLLNLTIHDEPNGAADLVCGLRRNTRVALDDARIFLEPSEVNLQALMLLACHGEEYALPTLSWMLMGHACRQAQALGLHGPKYTDIEESQRQLALFWSLFTVDKTCSLAFGRPTLLPTTVYKYVPSPEFRFLQKYQPHRHGMSLPQATYGAHYFCQKIELAKLAGHALDLLGGGNPVFEAPELIERIETWGVKTNQVLSGALEAELPQSTGNQHREMSIGIKAMEFQRLHLLLLLFQGREHYTQRSLAAARQTIALLPDLVSNSSQVYNGIVWQLLYYPFVAFFTLFRHVTTHSSSDAGLDLEALQTTVSYFTRMKKETGSTSGVCAKLEQTANVFHSLATFIVESSSGKRRDDAHNTARSRSASVDGSLRRPCSSSLDFRSYVDPLTSFLQSRDDVLVDPIDMDIDSILGCLDTGINDNSRGQNHALDGTFDWFSWDSTCIGSDRAF